MGLTRLLSMPGHRSSGNGPIHQRPRFRVYSRIVQKYPLSCRTESIKADLPADYIAYLVVVHTKVFEVLARFSILHPGTKRGDKVPQEYGVVDIGSNLELRGCLFLGEDIHDLATEVCPLLGVGEDIVARVGPPQSRVVVIIDLNSRRATQYQPAIQRQRTL